MKLLSIIDSVDLYGKERANIQVARVAQSHGIEVKVFINKEANKALQDELTLFETIKMPFPRNLVGKCRIFKYIWCFFYNLFKFHNVVKREKPDFVLIPTEIAIAYLYLPLLFSKVKVIFRCGDSPLVFRKRGFFSKIYGWIWKYFLVKRVDTLVCNARFIQNQIMDSGRVLSNNDSIIYNYPPVRESNVDSAEYIFDDRFLRIGFMGRIVEDKGVRELCNAVIAANRDGFNIVAYIGGNTKVDINYYEELVNILENNKDYSDRIKFVGNVNDIDRFYKNVDVVCVPSIYPEPMANVVTEAKIHHKLSIIFNQGGMPEIIEHMKTGYVCNNVSTEDLKNAFIYYATNIEEVNIQGEAASKSIENLGLCKEKFEERWMSVFTR